MADEQPVTPGRMFGTFEVLKASDFVDAGYSILLFSHAGHGKTTLAGSAADSEKDSPVCLLDAEGGAKAIAHRSDVDVIKLTNWRDCKKFKDDLLKNPIPWKTIIVDNLSEIIQQATTAIVGSAEAAVSQPKYGEMAREVLAWVRALRDVCQHYKINLILIAWDSVEKDDITGRQKRTLVATPALQKTLPGIVDIIGHISPVPNREDLRVVNFAPSQQSIEKFRRNLAATAVTVPNQIYYGMNNLPLPDILAAIKYGVPFPTSKYPSPTRANNAQA